MLDIERVRLSVGCHKLCLPADADVRGRSGRHKTFTPIVIYVLVFDASDVWRPRKVLNVIILEPVAIAGHQFNAHGDCTGASHCVVRLVRAIPIVCHHSKGRQAGDVV